MWHDTALPHSIYWEPLWQQILRSDTIFTLLYNDLTTCPFSFFLCHRHFQIHKSHYYLLVLLYYFSFKELVCAMSSKPLWASRTLLSVKKLVPLPSVFPSQVLASQKTYVPYFSYVPHLFSSLMFQPLYCFSGIWPLCIPCITRCPVNPIHHYHSSSIQHLGTDPTCTRNFPIFHSTSPPQPPPQYHMWKYIRSH